MRAGRLSGDVSATPARREGAAVAAALPLLVLALVAAGAAAVDGERAFREGRFAEAHDAFAAAVAAAGDEAAAELLWNEALAALAAGRPREAEIAAEVAAVRGGASFGPRRDFVLGSAAWARAARAESQASGPEAEPFAFDLAIAQVDAARDAWARAAASRADWPAARRNVERALLKRDELVAKRDEARRKAEEERKKDRADPEDATEGEEPPRDERAPTAVAQGFDEAPDLAARLFERLARKEAEKERLRASVRAARSTDVERDW